MTSPTIAPNHAVPHCTARQARRTAAARAARPSGAACAKESTTRRLAAQPSATQCSLMSNRRAIGDSDAITERRRRRRHADACAARSRSFSSSADRRRIVEVLGAHAHLVRRIQQIADDERRDEGEGADGGEAALGLGLPVAAEQIVAAPEQVVRGGADEHRGGDRVTDEERPRQRLEEEHGATLHRRRRCGHFARDFAEGCRATTERSGWRRKAGMSSSVSSAPESAADKRGSTFCGAGALGARLRVAVGAHRRGHRRLVGAQRLLAHRLLRLQLDLRRDAAAPASAARAGAPPSGCRCTAWRSAWRACARSARARSGLPCARPRDRSRWR